MVVSRGGSGSGERTAAWTVLACLAAIACWLGLTQSRFNPAVLVALSPPPLTGTMTAGSAGTGFATAAFLDALPGAVPASPVESYDPATLSDRIDGKAELYLAANFQEMSCRALTLANGAHVDVYVYAQAAPKDAFAVLSAQRRSGSRPLPLAPDAYATENALYFTRANHYVELVADRADADTMAGLEQLAGSLYAALGGGPARPAQATTEAASPAKGVPAAPPASTTATVPATQTTTAQETVDEKTLFPAAGLAADSLRLAASDAMGMAGFANVYTAEYALPSGAATALLAWRDAPGTASAEAKAFAGFLSQNGYAARPLPPDAAPLPAGAVLLAADGSYEILWTRGRMLAGVHDATSEQAALDLARELDARLAKALPRETP
ncbi:MAG: DUF6599 family protein [Acidobacteriota bacterium]